MRIGIIGLGKIAQTKYLPILLKHKEVEIIALCDQSDSLVAGIAEQYGINSRLVCQSVNELIMKKPELVFVLIHNHFDVALKLINVGISICVEKPLCWSSEQAESLLKNAKQKHVKIFALYMKQYDKTFITLQNEIKKRGVPLAVNVSCYAGNNKRWCDPLFPIMKESIDEKRYTKEELEHAWNTFFNANSIKEADRKTETQLLLQLGIHQLNLIRKLFGHLRVKDTTFSHNNGICLINTMLKSDDNVIVNYSLIPLFSGAWIWEEKYEIIYPDVLLVYHPGCPFLPISDAYLEITEEKGSIYNTTVKSGMKDSFEMMIEHILKCFDSDEDDSSVIDAIEDIKLIEDILNNGKND